MAPVQNNKRTSGSGIKRSPLEKGRWAAKGTKPLPDQASVSHILSLFAIHLCRKVLLVDVDVKLMVYSLALFFGSLLFDFLTLPRSYLGYKDNIFNLYFVKLGWGWMSIFVGAFVYMTSSTYGCGKTEIVKKHMSRILVGTVLWLFWSQWFFKFVEDRTGICLGKPIIKDQWTCDNFGFQWHAFDISGMLYLK